MNGQFTISAKEAFKYVTSGYWTEAEFFAWVNGTIDSAMNAGIKACSINPEIAKFQ